MRFFLPALLASCVAAHQMATSISVSGTSFGDGTCVRLPPNTDPLSSLTDKSIVCNVGGDRAVGRTCDVDAGQEITFTWRTWPDGSKNDPIDESHKGPCSVYLKKLNSFNDAIEGDGWFKIWHEGYENGMFCTERLRKNGGTMTARVPKDLAAGEYLMRADTLALHQAQAIGGAQWYVSCIQLHVYSTGGDARPPTISIPGFTTPDHPGVHYDIWGPKLSLPYQIPGPEPYVPTSAGGGPRIGPVNPPKSCPISNANWCSRPVPGFSDEAGCYRSAADCWTQADACYKERAATGTKGCKEWERICDGYNAHCAKCAAEHNCSGGFKRKRARAGARSSVGEKL